MMLCLKPSETERFFKVFPESALAATEALQNAGYEAYFVGGCVRDFLMNRAANDFDLTTNAQSDEIIGLLSASGFYAYLKGGACGTVGVKPQRNENSEKSDMNTDGGGNENESESEIEITPYRAEYGYYDHRHPTQIVFVKNIDDDLARRDFTVNSLAMTLKKRSDKDEAEIILVDIFGGAEDIEKRILRCVGSPSERFNEDALRILRALRFSAQLSFEIEEQTALALKEKRKLLGHISAERKSAELKKTLECECNGTERILKKFSEVFGEFLGVISPDGVDKVHGNFCEKLFYILRLQNFENFSKNIDGLKLSSAEKSAVLKYKKMFDAFPLSFNENSKIPFETLSKLIAENGYFFAGYLKIFGKYSEFAYIFEDSSVPKTVAELDICGEDLAAAGFAGKKIGETLLFLLESALAGKIVNRKDKLTEYIKTAKDGKSI